MTETQLILFLLPKVLMATLCGIIIGWEREVKHKVAGIKTHVLVCVGSTLFTALTYVIVPSTGDHSRMIGQIITGIGFLGGGVIFKTEDRVVGITSAALIWFMSSIGVIIGIGYLMTSLVFSIGLLILLFLLRILENKIK